MNIIKNCKKKYEEPTFKIHLLQISSVMQASQGGVTMQSLTTVGKNDPVVSFGGLEDDSNSSKGLNWMFDDSE